MISFFTSEVNKYEVWSENKQTYFFKNFISQLKSVGSCPLALSYLYPFPCGIFTSQSSPVKLLFDCHQWRQNSFLSVGPDLNFWNKKNAGSQ